MQQDDYHIMEQYLRGELSPEAALTFERRLEQEPALATELEWQKQMISFLKTKADREQLQDQLAVMGEAHFKETPPAAEEKSTSQRPLSGRRTWLVAAAILVLIIAVYLIRMALSPTSLYPQYATHPLLSLTEMSSDQPMDLAAVENAFNQGNYRASEQQLRTLFQEHPTDTLLYFYLGISLLEQERFTESTDIFQTIRKGSSDMQASAEWYLVLSALKEENDEEARRLAAQISEASEYYEQAQRLSNELRD